MKSKLLFLLLLGSGTTHANSLDKPPFIRAFNLHRPGFSACYAETLKRRPLMEGKAVFKFTLSPGELLGVEIQQSSGDDAMDLCLIAEARKIEFPKVSTPIILNYPLDFKRSDG